MTYIIPIGSWDFKKPNSKLVTRVLRVDVRDEYLTERIPDANPGAWVLGFRRQAVHSEAPFRKPRHAACSQGLPMRSPSQVTNGVLGSGGGLTAGRRRYSRGCVQGGELVYAAAGEGIAVGRGRGQKVAELLHMRCSFPDFVTFWMKKPRRAVYNRLQFHLHLRPAHPFLAVTTRKSVDTQQNFAFDIDKAVWHSKCTHSPDGRRVSPHRMFETMEGNYPMKNLFVRLWKEEEGQDLTEYALLLVLIALVAITTMKTLGSAVSNVFTNAAASLSST